MRIVLNGHTETAHKPASESNVRRAQCGALKEVPDQHVRTIAAEITELPDEFSHCGRCFEDAGGY